MSSFRIETRPGAVDSGCSAAPAGGSPPSLTCHDLEPLCETVHPSSAKIPYTTASHPCWRHSPRATLTTRDTSPTPTPTHRTFAPHRSLSPVAFIGGAALGVILVMGGLFFWWRSRKRAEATRKRRDAAAAEEEMTGGGSATEAVGV